MDHFSTLAPAYIRVLVLPVGQVDSATFLTILTDLQTKCSILPLADLLPLVSDDDFPLSPSQQSSGSLLYDFTAASVPEHHQQLSPFELWRVPLLVLGIVSCTEDDAAVKRAHVKKSMEQLRERYGRIVHRHLIVIDQSSGNVQHDLMSQHATSLAYDPSEAVSQQKLTHAVQEISVQLLRELSTYAQAMQASPSIQTPGQPSQGIPRPMRLRDDERPHSRHSTSVEPRSPSGEGDGSRPTSREFMPPPATTFEQMAASNTLGRSESRGSQRSKSHTRKDSLDRVPVQALSKEKLKDRGKARVGVVTGSIYLLAGQWSEALKSLVDHTTRLRALSDHIWHAKGLEYIFVCLLLHIWAGLDFQVPPICYQLSDKVRDRLSKAIVAELQQRVSTQQSPVEKLSTSAPDLLKHILLLYHAVESTLELPFLTVAEATIRFCKALTVVHNTPTGLRREDIDVLLCVKPTDSSTRRPESGVQDSTTSSSNVKISKASIADLLAHALPMHGENLTTTDYISILTGIAAVYSLLGMRRKKVITLRAVVTRLTASMELARKLGAAEAGIHPAASLSMESGSEALLGTMEGSKGLLALAQDIVGVFGVSLSPPGREKDNNVHISFGSNTLKEDILRDLLKLCESAPDLQGISTLVSLCMSFVVASHAAGRSNASLEGLWSVEEQTRFMGMMNRAHWLSKQLDLPEISAQYWDPNFVRSITFKPSTESQAVVRHTGATSSKASNTTQTAANPLLYDPNARKAPQEQRAHLMVQGEHAICLVALQNVLNTPVDIEYLKLVTDGVPLEGKIQEVRLGPSRVQQFALDVKPGEIGETAIVACCIKVTGCREQTFAIAGSRHDYDRPDLVKSDGQEAITDSPATDVLSSGSTVSVEIVEGQPLLLLQQEVSPSSTLMLLTGEKQTISTTLYNDSDIRATIQSIKCSTGAQHNSTDGQRLDIEPGQSICFNFEVNADGDHDHVDILFAYAAHAESKYGRILPVRVELSRQLGLQIGRVDAIPGDNDAVQLVVDVSNKWHAPLTLFYKTMGANDVPTDNDITVPATGQVQRIHLNVKRWIKNMKPSAEAQTIATDLQHHVDARWQTDKRSGKLSLNADVLGPKVINLLRGMPFAITLRAEAEPDRSTSVVKSGSFFTLLARIENRSGINSGPLRIQIQCRTAGVGNTTNARQGLAVAGSMQRLSTGITANDTETVQFALCPLNDGNLEISATVRSVELVTQEPLEGHTEQALRVRVVG